MQERIYDNVQQNTTAVPMVVWGTDADGGIFRQRVSAKELTSDGALLAGMAHPVTMGDLVGLQYKEYKAHARVTGLSQASTDDQWLLWVQVLDRSRCPWAGLLPIAPRAKNAQERRRFPRYKIAVAVHVRTNQEHIPTFFSTTDLSECGCYIETMLPLPKGTDLSLAMWLGSEPVVSSGIVRTHDAGVGMGIEFTGLPEAKRHLLSSYIRDHIGCSTQPAAGSEGQAVEVSALR
jgi:hypothetical protein